MTAVQQHRFHTLDAMRGVAAIIVALFHFRWNMPAGFYFYSSVSGYLAVDLFFALSGFVIAFSYDPKLAQRGGGGFARRRAERLLPMIWVGAVLGGIVLALTTSQSWAWIAGVAMLNAFLIPVFTPLIGPLGVNGPAWSLFYECVANLIYATFWRYLHRRALVLLVAVCGAAVPVVAIHYGRMNVGWELATIPAALTRVGFSFFLGVLLCRTRATWSRYLPTLNAWLVLAGVAMLLFVPCPRALRPIYDTLFIWFGSPLLIMLGAKTEPAAGHRRWFENLALLSYPLYAIHHPVRDIVQNLAIRTGVPTGPVAILTWLLLIPASLLIARVYETPVRRWLHRLRRAKPRSAPPQAAI